MLLWCPLLAWVSETDTGYCISVCPSVTSPLTPLSQWNQSTLPVYPVDSPVCPSIPSNGFLTFAASSVVSSTVVFSEQEKKRARGGNRHEEEKQSEKEEEEFVFSTQVAPAGAVLLREGGASVSSLLLLGRCWVQDCNKLCGTPPPPAPA